MTDSTIQFSNFFFGLKGENPAQIVKNYAFSIARSTHIPAPIIHNKMASLLRDSVVGVGEGVAIFDWVSDRIESPQAFCARIETPITFPSLDDKAIDFALVLISPEYYAPLHLRNLARLTRQFRDSQLLQDLKSATCADGMRAILHPENIKLRAA